MDKANESLVCFYQDLTPDEQAAWDRLLAEDAGLAKAFEAWRDVRAALRTGLEQAVPDRNMLVVLALSEADRLEGVSDAELRALEEARPLLRQALDRHPALKDVLARIHEERRDFERAWAAGTSDAAGRTSPSRPRARRRTADRAPARSSLRRGAAWSLRAAALLAVAALAAVFYFSGNEEPEPVVVRTGVDEMQEVVLPDGSRVRVLGESELRYRASGERQTFERAVSFRGSAYFDVIADAAHPFRVETPSATATVLGTEFGVSAPDDANTEVVLATGRVVLASKGVPDGEVALAPRQKSHVEAGQAPAPPVSVDLVDALGWTGLFVFRQEPYNRAARHLSGHFGVPVEVDASLEGEWVNGTFRHEDSLEFILETLTRDGRVRMEPLGDGGGYRLSLLP